MVRCAPSSSAAWPCTTARLISRPAGHAPDQQHTPNIQVPTVPNIQATTAQSPILAPHPPAMPPAGAAPHPPVLPGRWHAPAAAAAAPAAAPPAPPPRLWGEEGEGRGGRQAKGWMAAAGSMAASHSAVHPKHKGGAGRPRHACMLAHTRAASCTTTACIKGEAVQAIGWRSNRATDSAVGSLCLRSDLPLHRPQQPPPPPL